MSKPKLGALMVASGAGLLLGRAADAQTPGGSTRMVDVLGTPTRVLEIGLERRTPGQPVVVLQAGGNGAGRVGRLARDGRRAGPARRVRTWGEWFFEAAALGPVVAYDRPGLGESEMPQDWYPSPEGEARQLRKLLTLLDVQPPYVLVGHSWGCTLSLFFSGLYPDDVAGIVYIDPSHPASTPDYRWGTSDPSRLAEIQEYFASIQSFDAPPILGDGFVEAFLDRKIDRFTAWVRANRKATLTLVSESGHFIHLDRPELVTSALEWVLRGASNPN